MSQTPNLSLLISLEFCGGSDGTELAYPCSMLETSIQSLGQEGPLEKEIATHSGSLSWRIPWTEEPGGVQSMGSQRVGHD